MVVGKKERSDIKLEPSLAWLQLHGRKFRDLTVFSDTRDDTRRDVFVPNEAVESGRDLPQKTKVKYLGEVYTAELSFRTGEGGARIPVYSWRVSSSATATL